MAGGDCEAQVVNMLESRFVPRWTPDHCLIASVVRGADEVIREAVQQVWGLMPQVVDTDMGLGIDVAVPRPDHVGIDRLLQASEAFRVCGESVVVAAFGSALTVDLVTADGVFRGGRLRRVWVWACARCTMKRVCFPMWHFNRLIRLLGRIRLLVSKRGLFMGLLVP